jgi:hypothetical protein
MDGSGSPFSFSLPAECEWDLDNTSSKTVDIQRAVIRTMCYRIDHGKGPVDRKK